MMRRYVLAPEAALDLIVYRPETKPLQIVAILHGRRDVERLLKNRL